MARFYIEFQSRLGRIPDLDGVEGNSISDIHQEAEKAARDLLAQAILHDRDAPTEVVVYDDRRQKVAEVSLRDLIPMALR